MSTQRKAELALLLVTLGWGLSYLFMDISMRELGPITLNAYRFVGAFLVVLPFSWKRLKTVNRKTLKYSAVLGLLLLVVYLCATYGVKYTSISNSGFLIAISVLLTPLFSFLIQKKNPGLKMMLVVIACTIGIGLMTLDSTFHIRFGDLLCILCAVSYSILLILTEIMVRQDDVDAYHIGVFQMGFMGAYCTVLAFLVEEPVLPHSAPVIGAVLFLSLICTGFAIIVQSIAQQYSDASRVGVIFSLEPVFSGMAAFAFAGEILLPRAYVGEVIMLVSMLMMEVDTSQLFHRKDRQ